MEIKTVQNILEANDRIAHANREKFDAHRSFVVNLMSAPGSGKTSILEHTLEAIRGRLNAAVVEGDVQGSLDAERLGRFGVPIVQINTDPLFGGECHLDARMVGSALPELNLEGIDLVLIENVGNLVCPAEFWVGEDCKVMVLSVTEGDDKPLKYPLMFRVSDLLLLNKIDLIANTNFSMDRFRANVARVNARLPVIELSATKGIGIDAWIEWLVGQATQASGRKLNVG